MKRTVLIAVALLVVATAASAQLSVVGSKHDLSSTGNTTFRSNNITQVCVFCHTPHQPTGVTTDPLWNHTLSTVSTYGVYASDTLNASPTELGGGSSVSNLCMSCHDGTIGLGSLYNDPNDGGTPSNSATLISGAGLLGTDLTNDHPVNFTYNSALATEDGDLVDPPPADLLFGGTVQCASCHDPHDNNFSPFLVVSNDQSALCLDCHEK